MSLNLLPIVLVVGGGELGSAVSHRLRRSGFGVIVVEIANPSCIRRLVCYAEACYRGSIVIEGIEGVKVDTLKDAMEVVDEGKIPVLIGDYKSIVGELKPPIVVDARMLKKEPSISISLAPLVIGLGPGFKAGRDVHVVIETNRGINLGRLIYQGEAEANTGIPGDVMGYSVERVIRAPVDGLFLSSAEIGTLVKKGEILGRIENTDVIAPIDGLLRGLIKDGIVVHRGQKIGDVDPRGVAVRADRISDKGRTVSGGVLEAIMSWLFGDGHGKV